MVCSKDYRKRKVQYFHEGRGSSAGFQSWGPLCVHTAASFEGHASFFGKSFDSFIAYASM